MIYSSAADIVIDDVFLTLPGFLDRRDVDLYLKIEAFNVAGSLKLKTAQSMVAAAERDGRLSPGSRIIESSSGNLGIAMAVVCATRGYALTIVTDIRATTAAVATMRGLGAELVIIRDEDANGGFLHGRIDYIRRALARDPGLVWLNQYANPANPDAHRRQTAHSVHKEFGHVDVLAVGAGTTGTLTGCVEYFRERSPSTRVIGVDVEGSVTFGGPPGPRHIPGLGTSRVPEIVPTGGGYETCVVSEKETVAVCREVAARHGVLVGGSTGSVLCAVRRLRATFRRGATVVAISPDLGDRYLDTVYSDDWIAARDLELSGGAAATREERTG
ncbi:2,3-diaminopropionate biosynthesis protein SbnA [Actinophytocola xanthii]|uniref:2,3-diaminopropionate biosynthesis protein SbnA n=1 Tax=Actinophytocola xanthii TaxID=1912961 RepID=A0A1Q8CK62_9PSEU|nr:2,3-diaminopropionate biosynthesis protein SbnA [Actinophytocola xanthii]OLF14723.1 2,3-diaminopropionate biosynthesis protein SbnA [Actinophytocola xanthii]